MKHFFLLFFISAAMISCTKKTDENSSSTANFSITGIRDADLTTSASASFSFPITVTPNSGLTDNVNLFAEELPPGVRAEFAPSSGTTPFTSRVTFINDFAGTGGTHSVKITGTGSSGSKSYRLNITVDPYKGWRLGDSIYYKTDLYKTEGDSTHNPSIQVFAVRSGLLSITFGLRKGLPKANKTYKIAAFSGSEDNITITMNDDPFIYSATGVGAPTGTFTFDSLGKFIFKCKGVEMSNGLSKKSLDVSVGE